ncbi:MAG: GAF domain-containing protein [Anaerolineales bacterium]
MSKMTPTPVDLGQLVKLHQANYTVFQARTEKEIQKAIYAALITCQYISLYYSVNETGLRGIFAYDPGNKKDIEGVVEQVELMPAEIVQYFSRGVQIGTLNGTILPRAFQRILSENNCDRCAVIPVMEDVSVLAVLIIGARAEQQLSEENIDPLVRLCETIPIVLENVRTAHATQLRLRELETISETSEAISSSNDLAELYELIHKQIRTALGDTHFSVALYEHQNKTIEFPYIYEQGNVKSQPPAPLDEGLVSVLIRTRQPLLLVEDVERRIRALGAKTAEEPAKSWLGCPLVVGGEAIGALIAQDFEHEQRFGQDDLRFMIALSAQVAGGINTIHLLEDARRRALQLETVAEISREISSSLIVDNLLRQAVELLRERMNFYHAAIFLIDETGEYAMVREATGEAGAQMKRAGHKLAVGSKSIIGQVTQNKSPLVVNEIKEDPNYYPNPLLPETKAEACLPLKVGERVLGVVDVQSDRAFVFSEENIKILQILADQLAIAVVNSELFAEAQERLSQHRLLHHVTTAAASSTTIEEALNNAVQGLQVTLGGDQISILLADKEQKTLEVRSAIAYPNEESSRLKIPFGVGITGWVASHRQPQRVNDVTKDSRYIAVNPKVRSELAIPLIYRNEVLGILNVESVRTSAYSENDEEMLGTLAGSLAAIIAHSRLLEQFRQQVERERLLYDITSKIRRTSSPDKILSIAANELSKVLNTRKAQIEVVVQPEQNRGSAPVSYKAKN